MPKFASRNVVVGAIAFAAIVVILPVSGAPVGLLLLYLLYLVPALVALYLVVRWAVAAGVVDASRRGVVAGRGGAREILDARGTPGGRSPATSTSGCGATSKPSSRDRVLR